MNIGIDVDGVIMDTESRFRPAAELFDLDNNGKGIINADKFLFQDRFGWTNEMFVKFVEEYGFEIEKTAPLMPCAQQILKRLKDEGHRLIVITARGFSGKLEEDLTLEVFKNYNLEFDKIYFKAHNKAEICKNENIDYMIDDSPINIQKLVENDIKCLYFKSAHNTPFSHKNSTSVYSWVDIYKFFKNK